MRKKAVDLNQAIWRVRIAGICGYGRSGKKLSGSVRAVLCCLARNIYYQWPNPRPGTTNHTTHISVLTLSEWTGFSVDTVIRALATLEKEGLITRRVRGGNLRMSRITSLNWEAIQAGQVVTTYAAKLAGQKEAEREFLETLSSTK